MWKPLVLEVSDKGKIRWQDGRPMSVNLASKGYRNVSFGLHRAVAWAFHGPPPSRVHVADHIDRNPSNNRANNLRWLTQAENCRRGNLGRKKLTKAQVVEILSLKPTSMETMADMARRMGLSTGYIRTVRSGKAPAIASKSKKRITEEMFAEMRAWKKPMPIQRELAEKYMVSGTTIRKIWQLVY